MTKQLIVKNQTFNLDKIEDMSSLSTVLKTHIVKNKLYTTITGKNYAHVEGWQFAGGLLGLVPKVSKVENLSSGSETKWLVTVEIINTKTNQVVSQGFALCSNKEHKKKSFDEYAVLSMAQTRAIGKGYRNLLGWVMKLAGMESTPSEEMAKVGTEHKEPVVNPETGEVDNVTVNKPKRGQVIGPDGEYTYVCSVTGDPISDQEYEYSMKIFGKALSREAQKDAKRKK